MPEELEERERGEDDRDVELVCGCGVCHEGDRRCEHGHGVGGGDAVREGAVSGAVKRVWGEVAYFAERATWILRVPLSSFRRTSKMPAHTRWERVSTKPRNSGWTHAATHASRTAARSKSTSPHASHLRRGITYVLYSHSTDGGDRRTEDLEDDLRAPVRPLERLLARPELEGHDTLLERHDEEE